MNDYIVTAYARSGDTKSVLRVNRANGKIPAVVYGKKVTTEPVYIDLKDVQELLKAGASSGVIFRIKLPVHDEQHVMISEIQRDKVQNHILHVDFHQVEMNQTVKATVKVDVTGEPPGVKEGGILQVINSAVEVRCSASSIPTAIEADVSHLQLGEHLMVGDLKPPAGVEIRTDANEMIATVLAPQKELPEASDDIRDKDVSVDAAEKREAAKD